MQAFTEKSCNQRLAALHLYELLSFSPPYGAQDIEKYWKRFLSFRFRSNVHIDGKNLLYGRSLLTHQLLFNIL